MSNLKEKDSICFFNDLNSFISKHYNNIKELPVDFSNEDFINELIEKIVKLKKYDLITGLAKYMHNPPIDKLTDIIISSNNPATIYDFSEKAKNIDINRLVDGLINMKSQKDNIMYLSMIAEKCDKSYIDKIGNIIIEKGTAREIICFASNVEGANLTKLAYAVIKKGTPLDMFTFANEVEGAPTDILGYAILQSGDPECIFNFANEFPGVVPSNRILDALLECKNAEYLYYFAKEMDNPPMTKIGKTIIEIGSPKYIYCLACIANNRIGGSGLIPDLAKALVDNDKDLDYIYRFAYDVPNAPLDILEDGLIKYGSIYHIINFAKKIKGCNLEKLTDAACNLADSCTFIHLINLAQIEKCPIEKIINKFLEFADKSDILSFVRKNHCYSVTKFASIVCESKDSFSIYDFAKNVKNAPIESLASSLVSCQDKQILDHIVLFAKDFPNAPIDILADAVIQSKSACHILRFASHIKEAPIKDLAKAIIDTKDNAYINKFVSDITMDSDTFKLFIKYFKEIDKEKSFNLSVYHSLYYEND